jgi:hypothetical protein
VTCRPGQGLAKLDSHGSCLLVSRFYEGDFNGK